MDHTITSIEILPALPRDIRQTLRLCLASEHETVYELECRVNSLIELARALSLDLSRQWICRRGRQTLSACTCIESPGRTAVLLLPMGSAERISPVTLGQFIERVVAHESTRDIVLLQALIDVEDEITREALELAGFGEVAVLQYLGIKLTDASAVEPSPPNILRQQSFSWTGYRSDTHRHFAELIEASYQGGLDCPGLNELRNIEDVIEGHKSAGRFDPHHWLLLMSCAKPIACVLLSENPIRPAMELVYMGVHPEYRQQSIGRYVLQRGLAQSHRDPFETMTLAVDSNNHPARKLYKNVGFQQTHTRRAMIRQMPITSAKS